MPIDCLPDQGALCIPSIYQHAIDYRSLDLNPPATAEGVARAGARLVIDAPDLPVAGSTAAMRVQRIGDVWLYSRVSCDGLHCAFEIATADGATHTRVEREGIYPLRFRIDGTGRAGLDSALATIRVRIAGRDAAEWPTLASMTAEWK